MKTISPKHLLALVSASATTLILPMTAQAGTIVWGGAEGTQNYSSDGTPLEVGSSNAVTFQLGVFQDPITGNEFTPNFANASDWKDNWVPFGATGSPTNSSEADYQGAAADRADALTENFFRGSVSFGTQADQTQTSVATDGVTFNTPMGTDPLPTIGYQVYIWGYDNDQSFTAGDTPQWILFTGTTAGKDTNWVVPNSSASDNGTFAAAWDVRSADDAIVGRIPEAQPGEGEITNTPPTLPGSDIQFATIPEPSSALLLIIGLMSPVLRRRRRG